MDGRRNFPQEPDGDSRWYPDERNYDDRSRDDRGYADDRGYTPTRYADDRDYPDSYRVPEPRPAGRGYGDTPSGVFDPLAAPLTRPVEPPLPGPTGPPPGSDTGDMSGESASRSRRSESIDRAALQRPVSGGPNPGTSSFAAPTTLTAAIPAPSSAAESGGAVYRSRRPGLAVALGLLTVLFELPILRLFWTSMTADKITSAGPISSIFMILGLPMFALGLYGLIGGAAAAAPGVRPWLRTPLAYLPIALMLFIAAALAS